MQNKMSVLLIALFATSTAVTDSSYYNAPGAQVWDRAATMRSESYPGRSQEEVRPADGAGGPSKAEVLKYLDKKLARGKERISLIEQEISCVQNVSERNGSIWGCYEIAQQKKQRLKQKMQAQRPYQRRNHQGGGVMPNFDGMRMGMMPMPW